MNFEGYSSGSLWCTWCRLTQRERAARKNGRQPAQMFDCVGKGSGQKTEHNWPDY